ncbi:MAG: efflux RND transporter periplasmic adaptor subunit [Clostridia bacterium]|nr:efflux RND transporter periplasmic adaptor subunit [Clostridia bacterium]
MKTKWKYIIAGLAGFISLVIVISNIGGGLEAELLEVKPQTIANAFREEGTVIPQTETPIYAPNTQKVIDLPVTEGQEVKKGDILAVLDTEELELKLKELEGQLYSARGEQALALVEEYQTQAANLEAQLEKAKLELATAENNLARAEQLYQAGALSKVQLEEAQTAKELAELSLQQQAQALKSLKKSYGSSGGATQLYTGRLMALEAQLRQLQYQIEKSTLRSPIDGTVANIAVKKGELVLGGTPLMKVFQKDFYYVEVFVLAQEVKALEKGMEVELILDSGDGEQTFTGVIKEISPSAQTKISALGIEEQRVKVVVDVKSPKDIKLFPELKLDVEFITDKRENQLVVPKTALFPFNDGDALWVVKKGKAKIQPVKKGFETDKHVAIEEGLNEGDRVILNPQLKGLKEGKKIR